jgi:hypothetical protein
VSSVSPSAATAKAVATAVDVKSRTVFVLFTSSVDGFKESTVFVSRVLTEVVDATAVGVTVVAVVVSVLPSALISVKEVSALFVVFPTPAALIFVVNTTSAKTAVVLVSFVLTVLVSVFVLLEEETGARV